MKPLNSRKVLFFSIILVFGFLTIICGPTYSEQVQQEFKAVSITHELEGFEECTECHIAGELGGEATIVDEQHHCTECHGIQPMPPFDHSASQDDSCIICHTPE